jgi:curved DNA-binding protein CbpA
MDSYEILGVAPDADDDAVRKAYLEAVRKYSPDSDPEVFKRISAAYETLKDERSRLSYYLFDQDTPGSTPFQAFLHHQGVRERRKPMNLDQLKEFLQKCTTK